MTYRAIVEEVSRSAGFVPKTCWIADVLEKCGVKLRQAPNRIDLTKRQHPCPPEKRLDIVAALLRLGRISLAQAILGTLR